MKNSLIALCFVLLTIAIVARSWAPTQEEMGRVCLQNLKNLSMANMMYRADRSGNFPESLKMLAPEYLAEIPTCPSGEANTYSCEAVIIEESDHYIQSPIEIGPGDAGCRVSCSSEKHNREWRERLKFIGP